MLWLLALHPSYLPILFTQTRSTSLSPAEPSPGWLAGQTSPSLGSKFSHSRDRIDRQLEEKVTRQDFLLRLLKKKKKNPQIFSVTGSSKTSVTRVLGQQFVRSGDGSDRERTAHV